MMRLIVLLVLTAALSACAGQNPVIQVDVLRHHRLGPEPHDFIVSPHPDQNGADFAAAAHAVEQELTARGWRRATAATAAAGMPAADVIIRLRWGVDPPQHETILSPSAVAPFGMPYQRSSRRIDDPFPYWQAYRATYHPKWLSVTIVDSADASAAPYFEGRSTTKRGGADIGPLTPYLIKGMFDGFPGPSGRAEAKTLPIAAGPAP